MSLRSAVADKMVCMIRKVNVNEWGRDDIRRQRKIKTFMLLSFLKKCYFQKNKAVEERKELETKTKQTKIKPNSLCVFIFF